MARPPRGDRQADTPFRRRGGWRLFVSGACARAVRTKLPGRRSETLGMCPNDVKLGNGSWPDHRRMPVTSGDPTG
jgi:hypothetical protein